MGLVLPQVLREAPIFVLLSLPSTPVFVLLLPPTPPALMSALASAPCLKGQRIHRDWEEACGLVGKEWLNETGSQNGMEWQSVTRWWTLLHSLPLSQSHRRFLRSEFPIHYRRSRS